MRRLAPILLAVACVAVVVVAYLALGGASFEPTKAADPCVPRVHAEPNGTQEAIEQVVLAALDSAACKLGVSRESLVLALRNEKAFDALARAKGIPRDRAEQAIRDGVVSAIDDAEGAGDVSGFVAGLLRGSVERLPPWLLLDLLGRLRGLVS